ncbi:hypothetical protein ElyMa_006515700 [Elysia marginata]|uniref:Peptidase aspartic putative domain-containing protein n=1 Tax=Elysia marginata TaxID=1093978 RepID=A0AAV4I463_9GAST|nr:hypothetical protein ElyMa_006515700 [Elysia marginata]
MQVIKTDLKSSNGEVREVNVLFDGGSDRSFITESLARMLQLRVLWIRWNRVRASYKEENVHVRTRRRLEDNPELKEAYNKNLREMETSGIIKEVNTGKKRPHTSLCFM